MNANELRFGNLLQTHRSEPNELVQVNTIATHPEHADLILVSTCHFPHLTLCQCEPIPLTEEWLLKFGFKNVDDEIDHSEFILNDVSIFGQGSDVQTPFYYDTNQLGTIEVKYVHQLQNLYFSLTGEELTFSS